MNIRHPERSEGSTIRNGCARRRLTRGSFAALRMTIPAALAFVGAAFVSPSAGALEKPDVTYQVYQFPADKIPRIDGDPSDWAMVPEIYAVGTDQLRDDSSRHAAPDPKNLEV